MNNEKVFNRWLIVVGAILIQLCLGAIYAWSVFRIPLQDKLDITPTQASLPFSFVLIFFALSTVIGGRWQDKSGPRTVAIAGGIMLGIGMILASFAKSLAAVILFYGVVSGIGIGLAYVCPISAGVKWFPDKRGLITGLSVAGFGAGALIVAPLARSLIDTIGVFNTFRILGIIFFVLVFIGALILRNPPAGYKPVGWNPPAVTASRKVDFSAKEMLSTGQFYLIWLMYFIGCASGLMVIGQTSPIGQELAKYTKEAAALGVSLLAIFNALGRIFWGKISDSFGRMKTLFLMFLICGLAILSYNLIATAPVWFWFGISLVGFCFGGYLALFPAITADLFGTKSVGVNYGFVFTAYGVGGLLSNIFAPRVKELTGGYSVAFIVTGILCLIGAILTFLVKPRKA
ncbi:MAG: OFA family MFS transporter [Candidatus Latescibacteria bacterium]|nr:OFA family MFS transporter [Candidatus Latescibacterota bacterium]